MKLNRAIGVIDSGVGGLTVVEELMRQLPKEKLIYLGDTKRCPYGNRNPSEVSQFTWEMVEFLLEKNIKTLIIACNTATAFTLKDLQKKLPIPVIGVIQPGARAAIKSTRNNKIGIIGTQGTIMSQAYEFALKEIKTNITVNSLACPSLVPMVEKGILSGNEANEIVAQALEPLKDHNGIDTLILGCTHYPLIKHIIQPVIGSGVTIVSSSGETAREASTILDVHQLLNKENQHPIHEFYVTGDIEAFTKISTRLFKNSINEIHQAVLEQKIII